MHHPQPCHESLVHSRATRNTQAQSNHITTHGMLSQHNPSNITSSHNILSHYHSSHLTTSQAITHAQYKHPMPVHKTSLTHTPNMPYIDSIHANIPTLAIPRQEKTHTIQIWQFEQKYHDYNTSPSSHSHSSYSLLSSHHQSHHIPIRLMASQIHSKIPKHSPQTHAKQNKQNSPGQSTVWG